MHGLKSNISAIAVHPTQPILAIAGAEGFIILWDYVKKGDPIAFQFEQYTRDAKLLGEKKGAKDSKDTNKIFTVMEFTPDGEELLIGQADGEIKVVDPKTAKYKKLTQPLTVSYEKKPSIKHLVISEDGTYFATSDSDNGVALFKKDIVQGKDAGSTAEWIFNGTIKSHEIGITGLCFGSSIDDIGNYWR